jgi:hypothetical protein
MGPWAIPRHRSWDCRKGELTDAWASSSMGVLLSASAWSCCSLRQSKEHKLIKTVGAIPSHIEHLLFDTPQVVFGRGNGSRFALHWRLFCFQCCSINRERRNRGGLVSLLVGNNAGRHVASDGLGRMSDSSSGGSCWPAESRSAKRMLSGAARQLRPFGIFCVSRRKIVDT